MPISHPLRRLLAALALAALGGCTDPAGADNPYAGRGVLTPQRTAGGRQVARASAGFFHTCAVTPAGEALCWGSNQYGQLGTTAAVAQCEVFRCSRTPVAVEGGHAFTTVSAGTTRTCGLDGAGAAWCWGGSQAQGEPGYLGDGTPRSGATPVRVAADSPFVAITAGGASCALTASGVAYCWGENFEADVGDSTTQPRLAPVPVAAGALRFRAIAAGRAHVCAITLDDRLYCWGSNRWGQLGIGDVPYDAFGFKRIYPSPVWRDSTFRAVAAGGAHTCALTTSGRAYCWGQNENAQQLGDESGVTHRGVPGPVAGGHLFVDVTAGTVATCGLTASGESWCWGSDYFGGLGDGREVNGGVGHPVLTRGGPYRAVTVGGSHACGVTSGGELDCWGDGFYGQVGR